MMILKDDYTDIKNWICSAIETQGFLDQSKKMRYCNSVQNNVTGTGYECQNRFCIPCQLNQQKVLYLKYRLIFKRVMDENPNAIFAKLTLTDRDCYIEQTREKITIIQRAWEKLVKRRWFSRDIVGWTKITEVSGVKKKYGFMLHPHFHIILVYRDREMLEKRNIGWWQTQWQQCLGAEYDTNIDIREITQEYKNKIYFIYDRAAYFIKYAMKVPEYLFDVNQLISQDAFADLYFELMGKKRISNGGITRQSAKIIKESIKVQKIQRRIIGASESHF